ncbi:hypothetical protein PspLS_03833 [Pyricularia sp. CBS 133598]|nr:hypothetical protein PspLS_03833 [Pyricularia sp. CBS 133598]
MTGTRDRRHCPGQQTGSAGDRAGLRGGRELAVLADHAVEQLGRAPVRGELHSRVGYVEQLGRDVALPKARDALMSGYVPHGRPGALVNRPATQQLGSLRQRVGERVRLQLEADFDDIEGSDDEAVVSMLAWITCW